MRPSLRKVIRRQRFADRRRRWRRITNCCRAERFGELHRGRLAILWLLGERTIEHARDAGRHTGPERVELPRRGGEMHPNQRLGTRGLERRSACQHFKNNAGERVDVGRGPHGLTARLLGTHVERRAKDPVRHGHRLRPRRFGGRRAGDAEIGDECDSVSQQDVLGLDVTVNKAVLVSMAQRTRDLACQPQRFVERQLPLSRQAGTQRLSLDERHHVEQGLPSSAGIEERNDVRMVQPRGNLDLAQEAVVPDSRNHRGLHHLDGNAAMVLEILGEIDGGHPPAADLTHGAVAIERGE